MKTEASKVDPDVKIPAAVKAAAARSEELHRQMRGQTDEEAAEETGSEAGEGGARDGDGQVTREGNPDTEAAALAQEGARDERTAKEKPQSDQAQETRAKPDARDDSGDPDSWEHKYKSLHGRHRRDQDVIRQLTERVHSLEGLMSSMQSEAPAKKDPEGKKTQVDIDPADLITPEEAADYGEDFLNVVGRRARQEVAPVIKQYQDEIAELKKKLDGFSGFVKQDAQEKLLQKLDSDMPSWREMNTNEDFLSWLALPDPYSGGIRHDMLKAAYSQGNANRVLAFFKGFLAEEAVLAPAASEPDPTETRVSKVPLEKLAAPGRAKTAAAGQAPAEKPVITRAQVAQFYSDVAAGKYRGRDAEKDRLEAEIFSAERDRRIR